MDILHIVSGVFVGCGFLCALIVFLDINMGRYQAMPIMNIAWIITCSYSCFLGLFMYYKYGRAEKAAMQMGDMAAKGEAKHGCGAKMGMGDAMKPAKEKPMWVKVYISSTHCGAGCGAADIFSENLIFYCGITFFGAAIWASFIIDYIFALIFGVVFQYLNIRPMRPELTRGQAWANAIKADVVSLTSFQLGMYGWIAIVHFVFQMPLAANTFTFWFMMQIGLTIGLLTTYPVNYILIKTGIKVPCA
ncbi:MAG: hypothetical protein COB66_04380 [Coxiella sp. (in: Bacteria)]|nr:MAG: hypothetical protein COB66_04380 [Coxiella sp. (in: g-proteobacteria)]